MSLGRARAMSQLAGEADLLSPGKPGSPLQPSRARSMRRKLRGVNGSCERRAHPPKAGSTSSAVLAQSRQAYPQRSAECAALLET
jgi:hypothetical protein